MLILETCDVCSTEGSNPFFICNCMHNMPYSTCWNKDHIVKKCTVVTFYMLAYLMFSGFSVIGSAAICIRLTGYFFRCKILEDVHETAITRQQLTVGLYSVELVVVTCIYTS